MRILSRIPLSLIDTDRQPVGPRTTALMDHLRAGGTVPPIHVVKKPGGRYQVLDGRHRILSHRMLGLPNILVRYGITKREASETSRC